MKTTDINCFMNQKQTTFIELQRNGATQKTKSLARRPLMIYEKIVSIVSTNTSRDSTMKCRLGLK